MLFNSLGFLLFLPIVFLLYWFVFNRSLKLQNAFIVVVSYVFYGWWDWKFLMLIAFTSACSYFSGLLIEKEKQASVGNNRAKVYAVVNVVVNLVILGIFKYFNFFSENLEGLFHLFGLQLDWVTLDVILPVGISFYTFQALSYTIDVYKGSIKPTHSIIDLFAYISFFPQLVAGPIERSTNLLPQFEQPRSFKYEVAVDGCRQMLWGFFKKIALADVCAGYVDHIFGNFHELGSISLIIGALLFTFQIYGDFSGYSDIAIGCSKLFGIQLMRNFNMPYFSRDIAEFWRRWHISLTTWFRDYIYIPLGGSRGSKAKTLCNTFVVFLVSGLWHGANWTYIVWGIYHALLFIPLLLVGTNRKNRGIIAEGRLLPSFLEVGQMAITFVWVAIGWIIFRANTLSDAYNYVERVFTAPLLDGIESLVESPTQLIVPICSISILLVVEWVSRTREHAFSLSMKTPFRYTTVRWGLYLAVLLYMNYVVILQSGTNNTFIYFQF